MILADDDALAEFDKLLRSRYDVKRTGTLGFDTGDDHEVVMLNRVLRATTIDGEEFIEIEADSRHAELIVQKLGLATATAAATPSIKLSDAQAVAESCTGSLDICYYLLLCVAVILHRIGPTLEMHAKIYADT